jgi:pyruvate/2-oxoglutarate dehydrogenase complex dihydrolipoamide dehydrogenase (E3) component
MRVLGLHITGPSAGEITQGFAIGIFLNARKADFDNMFAIHPTLAEVRPNSLIHRRIVFV